MPLADVPAYVERVPILVEINSRYLGMNRSAFAQWLVADLERARAVRRQDGLLVALGN